MERIEAVRLAKQVIKEVFADEKIGQIGLEEINFDADQDEWRVTIGFAHRAAKRQGFPAEYQPNWTKRSYKVVHLKDEDGQFVGLRDRFLTPAP